MITCLSAPLLAADGIGLDPSNNPYTARHLGMGGASLGFADDASGVFINASGLAKAEFPQMLGASRKLVLDEVQYSLFCWAMPSEWGTFGIGYTGLNVGDSIPTRRDEATNRIIVDPSREATAYDNSTIALAYAKQLNPELSVGGALKLFNQSISGGLSSRASGTGIDLGATYTALPWLTAAANLQNVLEGTLAWGGGASDKIGGYYKLGGRATVMGTAEALLKHQQTLIAGLDIDIPHSKLGSTNYHLGLDYFPLPRIALRVGLNMEQSNTGLTFGVGLVNGGFRFDYAFAPKPGLPNDTPHYFSLAYIGERVLKYDRSLKRKESGIVWLSPQDRSVTNRTDINIKVRVQEKRILDEKKRYVVTAISETSEVYETAEYADLAVVYLNGIKIDQVGTIETSSPLAKGRNVFEAVGYSKPEKVPDSSSADVFVATSEVKVLRFNPFSDTPMSHWAIEPIALSVTLGLIKGYPDDTFRPEQGITRAELVTLLIRTLPVKLAESVPYSGFSDVGTSHWAAKYIAYGNYLGLVTGYPDGTFKPNRVLNRAEGVTILARYAKLALRKDFPKPFPDLTANFWANEYIDAAQRSGMLVYLVGRNFEPTTHFSRAEATEVLYRTPQIQRGVNEFWETGVISAGQVEVKTPASTTPAAAEQPLGSDLPASR
ncbi:MAG: S-layer homology domain-containing protein [Candidatus Saganbacteria bacterium]|nr:S-layer homology domain-containing protein [Candidatus Saganbacteria bacterium]